VRINGENPAKDFQPCPGFLGEVKFPTGECSAVLCCAVLCCAVLCCAVLCCAVLCCALGGVFEEQWMDKRQPECMSVCSPSSHHLPHTDMDGVRVDTWVETGTEISPYYDSMLGKLMVYAPTRDLAVAKIREAIAATQLKGVPNNLEFLGELVKDPRFEAGQTTTSFLDTFDFKPHVMEVIMPGEESGEGGGSCFSRVLLRPTLKV